MTAFFWFLVIALLPLSVVMDHAEARRNAVPSGWDALRGWLRWRRRMSSTVHSEAAGWMGPILFQRFEQSYVRDATKRIHDGNYGGAIVSLMLFRERLAELQGLLQVGRSSETGAPGLQIIENASTVISRLSARVDEVQAALNDERYEEASLRMAQLENDFEKVVGGALDEAVELREGKGAIAEMGNEQNVGTLADKLDLARSYIDQGDFERARETLNNVLAHEAPAPGGLVERPARRRT